MATTLGWTTEIAAWSPTAAPVWADTAGPGVRGVGVDRGAGVALGRVVAVRGRLGDRVVGRLGHRVRRQADAWDWATAYDPDTDDVDEVQLRVRAVPVPNTVWSSELIAWVSSITNGSSWLWVECAATAAPACEETSAPVCALWASAACAEGWVTAWFACAAGWVTVWAAGWVTAWADGVAVFAPVVSPRVSKSVSAALRPTGTRPR